MPDAEGLDQRATVRQCAFVADSKPPSVSIEPPEVDFAALVAEHQTRVARLAHRLLGWSAAEVDDVVQEVFWSAYRNLPRFRGECSLGHWLATLTVRACRTVQRRRLVSLRWWLAARHSAAADHAPPADAALAEAERSAAVRQAVQSLADRDREIVVLRYFEDYSVDEIAQLVGQKQNAVEVRLHRARARLKELLADWREDS